MPLDPGQAVRLARALRSLRESRWPDAVPTQAQLATAFSVESRVAPATVSTWESASAPKTPPASRLNAYARFFATRRSLEGPRLLSDAELTPAERAEAQRIEDQLSELLRGNVAGDRKTFSFDDGPVTIVCPEAPPEAQGPLARASDPNFTRLQRYADLDALIEIFGHVRASNPALDVFHRLPSEITADDLSTHVILLGGIGWNQVTRRFQDAIGQVPITQVDDPSLPTGEIFRVEETTFNPVWEDPDAPVEQRELKEDVAFLARMPNPFKISRTLTLCNGIHSRGVLGAVRALTDHRVRETNERYLAERFPDGRFALLLRVPVVAHETMSPDLQNPAARLFEWPSGTEGHP